MRKGTKKSRFNSLGCIAAAHISLNASYGFCVKETNKVELNVRSGKHKINEGCMNIKLPRTFKNSREIITTSKLEMPSVTVRRL